MVIDVPEGWYFKSRSKGGAPATVTMRNDDSVLHFTLLWNVANSPDFNSAEQMLAALKESSAKYVLDGSGADLEFSNRQSMRR